MENDGGCNVMEVDFRNLEDAPDDAWAYPGLFINWQSGAGILPALPFGRLEACPTWLMNNPGYPAVTWIENRALITYFNYKGGLSLQLRIVPAAWFHGE